MMLYVCKKNEDKTYFKFYNHASST